MNRPWTILAACVTFSALFALGGCETLETPLVEVVNVRVAEQTADAARIEAMIELTNPNDTPLPLTKCNYTISVAGAQGVSLEDIPHRTLPALGKQTVKLPAAIRTNGANVSGAAYNVSGSVTYEPPGEMRKVFTESGIPLPWVDFAKTGRVE